MNRALYAGLSSTTAQQVRMDVAANNLANVNTVGFKAGRTEFQDAFYQTLRSGMASTDATGGISPMQVGVGVSVASVGTLDTQGALQSTGQSLDAAIDGDGMFVVSGAAGTFYTRDGAFALDDANTLVMSSSGLKVQGWMAVDGTVDATGPLTDLVFPLRTTRSPRATTGMVMEGNLAAGATTAATSSASVYDSLGVSHEVELTFTPTATTGAWSVSLSFDGAAVGPPTTVTFGTDGKLISGSPIALAASPAGAAAMSIELDLSQITQYVSGDAVTVQSQDGYGPAALQGLAITGGGILQGSYSDGRSMTLGQLAVAGFVNPGGLQRTGDNLYASNSASGLAQVGAAGTGGRGNVVGQSLEASNTDLTSSFLDMLITQRAYQASTRVISTASSLLEDAIGLANR